MKTGFGFHLTFYLILLKSCSSEYFGPPVKFNETFLIPRVVNGRPASLGDAPYQVGFKALISRRYLLYGTFCGGAIVSGDKVLSAAHCFEAKKSGCLSSKSIVLSGKSLTNQYAVAGTLLNEEQYRESGTAQWRELKYVVYPTKYKFPKHDICVVIVVRPFHFNSNVASIPYATEFRDYVGECLASGYGRLSSAFEYREVKSTRLMLADLAVLPTEICNAKHRQNMRRFVCTSDKVSDTSKGDSGGPLVCANTGDPMDKGKGVLVGVVSGARKYAGSFFTRVSAYHKYIEEENCSSLLTPSLAYYYVFGVIYFGFYLFYLRFIFSVGIPASIN